MVRHSVLAIVFAISGGFTLTAQTPLVDANDDLPAVEAPSGIDNVAYVLGPQDAVLIKVLNEEELGTLPYPIDLRGKINVPRVGRIQAAGATVEQLEAILT